jgi:ABC-type branched-subunit amino acid transport system permease subunit
MIYVLFAVLGLGSGAAIALMGLGIVVGFRGSGVVNFSQGGIAAYAAYVYYDARVNGQYLLPIPGLPGQIQITRDGLATVPALLIAVATAGLLGLLLDLLVLRHLRSAPTLAKVVATVGVLLILETVVVIRFGTNVEDVRSMLPQGSVLKIAGTSIPNDRLFLVGLVAVVAVLLWAGSRFTRLGIATRAAAENERAAVVLGYSPGFLSAVSWTVAGCLAGLAGVLISPITSLTPEPFAVLIIPALAAALVGRFSSLSIVAVAGLVLGMAQSLLLNLPERLTWLPQGGLPDALPLIVIIAIMFLGGRTVPDRQVVLDSTLPPVPQGGHPFRIAFIWLIPAAIALVIMTSGYRLALINTLIAAIACLSLVVVTGFVGQTSLFQLTLAGVSAYMLAGLQTALGVPFPIAPILAALGAAVVGVIAAIPALRVRGVNLAVVTLAAGWAVEQVFFNNINYTGGLAGASVTGPHLFGLHLDFTLGDDVARPEFGLLVLAVLAIVGIAVVNLRRTDTGRRMLAVRANERAAAAMGIDVRRTKLLAFAIAAFIAGLAGALTAYQQALIAPSSFDVLLSLSLLAIAYLGGITSVTGAVIGGLLVNGGMIFYALQQDVFGGSVTGQNIQQLVAGLGLVLTAIFNPVGIAGGLRQSAGLVRWRLRGPGRTVAERPVAAAVGAPDASLERRPGGESVRS